MKPRRVTGREHDVVTVSFTLLSLGTKRFCTHYAFLFGKRVSLLCDDRRVTTRRLQKPRRRSNGVVKQILKILEILLVFFFLIIIIVIEKLQHRRRVLLLSAVRAADRGRVYRFPTARERKGLKKSVYPLLRAWTPPGRRNLLPILSLIRFFRKEKSRAL